MEVTSPQAGNLIIISNITSVVRSNMFLLGNKSLGTTVSSKKKYKCENFWQ